MLSLRGLNLILPTSDELNDVIILENFNEVHFVKLV